MSGQWLRHAEQGLTGDVFHIRAAISVRIGRVDRLAQVPTRLAGSETIKATFFLEPGPTAIATGQSEDS